MPTGLDALISSCDSQFTIPQHNTGGVWFNERVVPYDHSRTPNTRACYNATQRRGDWGHCRRRRAFITVVSTCSCAMVPPTSSATVLIRSSGVRQGLATAASLRRFHGRTDLLYLARPRVMCFRRAACRKAAGFLRRSRTFIRDRARYIDPRSKRPVLTTRYARCGTPSFSGSRNGLLAGGPRSSVFYC